MPPIAFSFSDGSNGECVLEKKRGVWNTEIPSTVYVRKSDDSLRYRCKTSDGRDANGAIECEMGAKIVASAVFLDLALQMPSRTSTESTSQVCNSHKSGRKLILSSS